MSTEILVNVATQETRVALVEGGALQEVFVQRESRHGLVGNLYKGRVQRVLPGMQAAFVEIGLDRTAFLHARDIQPLDHDDNGQPGPAKPDGGPTPEPRISELLTEGQDVLVQIVKDPMGQKGARLTTQISIPSRYLVLLPHGPQSGNQQVGISVKIEDSDERDRLRGLVEDIVQEEGADTGFIVRTAGEGASREALRADVLFLTKLWRSIRLAAHEARTGAMVYGDLPMVMRILRDLLGTQVDRVRIDSQASYEQVMRFARRFLPEVSDRIELHGSDGPIFDLFGVEDELARALERKVPLKSGGYLVIDQTEAMTTVDVNTGAFVGRSTLEETIFKTNLEAAQAVARQLRLRNLGGIIIVDFIDMEDAAHQQEVLRVLGKAMDADPARSVISGVSSLGLVEMTRKRTRESLEHILCEPCPSCQGRGHVKTAETVCFEIFREIMRSARQFDAKEMLVLCAPDVAACLLDEQSAQLAEMEDAVGVPIRLQAESQYTQEHFDVVLM